MYNSRLTPGDPYSFSAGHTQDPTAFGAAQTPPAAFGAFQTDQTEFGAGKIPDHTAIGAVQTSNPTPDQTAFRYTAGFSATSSTPPQAPGFSWFEFIEIKFQELTGLVESKFEELSNKIEDVRRGEERKENDKAEGNTDLIKAGVFILSNSVPPLPLFKKKQISLPPPPPTLNKETNFSREGERKRR